MGSELEPIVASLATANLTDIVKPSVSCRRGTDHEWRRKGIGCTRHDWSPVVIGFLILPYTGKKHQKISSKLAWIKGRLGDRGGLRAVCTRGDPDLRPRLRSSGPSCNTMLRVSSRPVGAGGPDCAPAP